MKSRPCPWLTNFIKWSFKEKIDSSTSGSFSCSSRSWIAGHCAADMTWISATELCSDLRDIAELDCHAVKINKLQSLRSFNQSSAALTTDELTWGPCSSSQSRMPKRSSNAPHAEHLEQQKPPQMQKGVLVNWEEKKIQVLVNSEKKEKKV